jgi:hypothetical protein
LKGEDILWQGQVSVVVLLLSHLHEPSLIEELLRCSSGNAENTTKLNFKLVTRCTKIHCFTGCSDMCVLCRTHSILCQNSARHLILYEEVFHGWQYLVWRPPRHQQTHVFPSGGK